MNLRDYVFHRCRFIEKTNKRAGETMVFERLIIAADFGRFFTLCLFGSGRRRSGNQPLHGGFKPQTVRGDEFCFRHTRLWHRLKICASQNHLAAFQAFVDALETWLTKSTKKNICAHSGRFIATGFLKLSRNLWKNMVGLLHWRQFPAAFTRVIQRRMRAFSI
jgi:hypothetical protein